MIDLPSKNHGERPAGAAIDMLVLHHTAQPLDVSLDLLCFGEVSSHYLIDEGGDIYRLVDEDRVAWHAGLSWWGDRRSLNACSIGIEIVNPDGNCHPYPAAQQAAVIGLCREILVRHPAILPRNVVAHSDIAPQRKDDPGTRFFWRELAAAGVGLWSDARAATPAGEIAADRLQALLRRFGYPPPHRYGRKDGRFVYVECSQEDVAEVVEVGLPDIVAAFQRHYRPARVDGIADGETLARVRDLLCQAGESSD